jgi:hypothetical protein
LAKTIVIEEKGVLFATTQKTTTHKKHLSNTKNTIPLRGGVVGRDAIVSSSSFFI